MVADGRARAKLVPLTRLRKPACLPRAQQMLAVVKETAALETTTFIFPSCN
jgi:hypothetical protein